MITGKRRKTRCLLLSSTDSKCVGCYHRGSTCLSQEFSAESAVPVRPRESCGDDELSKRLDRFERLLNQVVETITAEKSQGAQPRAPDNTTQGLAAPRPPCLPTPASLSTVDGGSAAVQSNGLSNPSPVPASPILQGNVVLGDVRQTLYDALPCAQDAEVIVGTGRIFVFLQALCHPTSEVFDGYLQPISVIAKLPQAADHPALLARSFPRLAIGIQPFHPSFDCTQLQLREPPRDAMARFFHLATTHVTSKDNTSPKL